MPLLEIRDTSHEDSRKNSRVIIDFDKAVEYNRRSILGMRNGVELLSVLNSPVRLPGASLEAFSAVAKTMNSEEPYHIIYYPHTKAFYKGDLRTSIHCG